MSWPSRQSQGHLTISAFRRVSPHSGHRSSMCTFIQEAKPLSDQSPKAQGEGVGSQQRPGGPALDSARTAYEAPVQVVGIANERPLRTIATHDPCGVRPIAEVVRLLKTQSLRKPRVPRDLANRAGRPPRPGPAAGVPGDQQRETALALQHAILGPAHLPRGFAVRYQAASRPLQVGGDWYDIVDLEDGRIALIVGDCVGHGLAAAAVMGQVRSACRALLFDNPSPSAALAGMDRFAARLPGAECTTAVCAVLNLDTGELAYSSAGHPPPILVHADGTIRMLDDGHTIGLGIRPDWSRPEAHVTMPAHATLLLYTDGLVERRRIALEHGISRAAALVHDGRTATLDDLADQIMTGLAPSGGYQDDVVLLLYRHPAPLELKFPADISHLASTRTALRSWLTRARVDPDQTLNVLIAAGEAVANAIEHGHRHSPAGTISLAATALVDQVQLTITDTGSWKPPQPTPDPHRGRGITLMRGLMHDVTIDPGPAGTTVHLSARIT